MSESLPVNDSLIGATVDGGRYEIVKLIGEGGMGRVFQARQVSMNRMVALKILRAQLAGDEQLLARFQQEALSVSRLRHPNTITIFDYGRTEDGFLFMAMELLGGRSLYSMLREDGPLPLSRTLHMMDQVAGAVAEAHQLGIVHRDLKPENIQIEKVGNDPDFAKVLDFGIAKIMHGEADEITGGKTLTMAGAIFGTPHYMSPEQVHGQKIDHRTDVYSMGVIIYELLAGKAPFDGATPMAVMMAQASKAPPDIRETAPDADITDAVAELINECLAKDREERIQSAGELITRIQQVQYEMGEITSTNARLFFDAQKLEARANRRSGAPASARPSGSQGPSTGAQADAPRRSTPDHTGHLATMPPPVPDLLDDAIASPRGGRSKWVAAVLVLAAVGGAAYYWRIGAFGPEAATHAAAGTTDDEGDSPERIVIDSRAREITFTLESTPTGAEVLAGDEPLGTTPYAVTLKENERRTFNLRLAGHRPQDLVLEGKGETAQKAHVSMVPMAAEARPPEEPPRAVTAWVALSSQPIGAEVFLGDDMLGVTPFEWKPPVSDTPVTLRFAKDGFSTKNEQVTLATAGGAAQAVDVALKKKGRRTWRPRGGDKTPPTVAKQPETPTKVVPAPKQPESPYQKL